MDDKKLDNIFKTAFNPKSKISQEEGNWDEFALLLKKRSRRNNFLSFSLNRLNIYYVGIILACFGGIIYSQYLTNTPSGNSKTNDSLQADTSVIQSKKSGEARPEPIVEEKEGSAINNKGDHQSKSGSKKVTSSFTPVVDSSAHSQVTPVVVKDTIPAVSTEPTPAVKAPPVVVMKRKKTVVLTTPQDTVIKIDTVKVKKGRKR